MLSFNNRFWYYINNYRIIDSNLYVACPFDVIVCILSQIIYINVTICLVQPPISLDQMLFSIFNNGKTKLFDSLKNK